MPLSFNPTDFSQRYGFFCFSILADLTVYSLFSRTTTAAKAQIAGLVGGLTAGFGLAYVFADRTSLMTALIGAGLYIAYKVGFYFLTHLQLAESSPLDLKKAVADLVQSYNEFQKQFIVTSDEPLSIHDKTRSELRTLNTQIPFEQFFHKWINQKTSIEKDILSLLQKCRTILLQIDGTLKKETAGLENDYARLSKMSELLKNPDFNPDYAFGQALVILYRSYRSFERSGYTIYLPHLQNADEDKKSFLILAAPSVKKLEISSCFENTEESLKDLIATLLRDRQEDDAQLIQNRMPDRFPYIFLTPPVALAAEQLGF